MLSWRLLLGTLLVAALAGLCWLDYSTWPGAILLPVALVLAFLAAGEMRRLVAEDSGGPRPWVVYLGTLLVVVAAGVPLLWPGVTTECPLGRFGWPMVALALAVLVALVVEMRCYERPSGVALRLAQTVFVVVCVAVPLSFAVLLRGLGGNAPGLVALVSMIVVVKMSDIGAYTVGRLCGRNKMAPLLSPGKTWEGALGGAAFALVAAWATFAYVLPMFLTEPLPHGGAWWVYGLLLAAAGMLGDLSISLMKRDAQCKDSSSWLPGFGGVLDILDSVFAAAPAAYVFWAFMGVAS